MHYIKSTFIFIDTLLKRPKDELQLKKNSISVQDIYRMFFVTVFCSALYGLSMGAYVGGKQILYATVKMPLFFIATLILSFGAMYIFQMLVGAAMSALEALYVAMISISMTTVVLLGFSPISILMSISLEQNSFFPYRVLMLMHVIFIAIAGFVSLRYLWLAVKSKIGDQSMTLRTLFIWILTYSFTGCQMAWTLRPFVGDYEYEIEFFRQFGDNIGFEHNFYVAIIKLINELIIGK